ncbi:hypothetical protein BGZ76_006601 [Entomortierella beljakovae]|nr:hypothetical protein BGZ76_006601 [Entomortierella beljakovae]
MSATTLPIESITETFKNYIDLAVATRGGKVLTCTDEWFADSKNLLTATAPISAPGRFVPSGAWYDGWETRRHNAPNHDWCVIQLGYAGTVAGFEIDTSYFTGNHSPFVSVEGYTETDSSKTRTHEEWATVQWTPILNKVPLNAHSRHGYKLEQPSANFYTHIRFCMYPDGGVARLRVYGTVHAVRPANKNEIYDLASASAGSTVTDLSDAHYGHPSNMLLPGRGHDMSDGWETKRSRAPGHTDFATTVTITGFEEGSDVPITLIDQAPMTPHRQHFFKVASDLTNKRIAQVKIIMIPDGGIKRVRVWGASQLPAVLPENSLVGVRQELPDEYTWNQKKN